MTHQLTNPLTSLRKAKHTMKITLKKSSEGTLALIMAVYAVICSAFLAYPLSDINAAAAQCGERTMVVVGGSPFGIKMRSEGVMVISVAENSPAQRAGIKAGDIISIVNGQAVDTNAQLAAAIQMSSRTKILLRRGDAEILVRLTPQSENGFLKIGAFVRDSAAGIGTLTFCNPDNRTFAGLGHSVSDVTTGSAVPLGSGEITTAEIYDVIKGKEGSTGELCGLITPDSDIGSITANTSVGVFGTLSEEYSDSLDLSQDYIPVALKSEVKIGKAEVITTADGTEPKAYSVEIERINFFDTNGSKALTIRITDKELLSLTGGIVCGMSGSPITQNGRLIGAVTHVFVNDPTRGYAVFAQTMLDEANALTDG